MVFRDLLIFRNGVFTIWTRIVMLLCIILHNSVCDKPQTLGQTSLHETFIQMPILQIGMSYFVKVGFQIFTEEIKKVVSRL